MINPVIATFFINVVVSQLIYPSSNNSVVQWNNEGSWIYCNNNTQILAQNCNPNDDKFIECYKIPDEGLCSQNISTSQDQIYGIMSFIFKNQSSVIFKINHIIQNIGQNQITTNKQVFTSFQNPLVPFQIQLNHQGSDLYLVQCDLQVSNLSDFCLKQDQNLQCLLCADSYFLYNGKCAPISCMTQLSNLFSNGISQRMSYENGNIILEFIINNIPVLGDCIFPRLYLIKNLDNPQMTYIFPKQYVTRPDQSSFKLTLPLQDFNKFPCEMLETSTDNVFQCYVSLALTVQQLTQFQYITIMRVQINKSQDTQITYSDQGLNIPKQCCESLSVNLLSEAKILKISQSLQGIIIQLQQILRDPNYKNQPIKFMSAIVKSGGQVFNLRFINSTVDQMTITHYLQLDPSVNISNQNATVLIQSNLALSGRMLGSQATNIQPIYILSSEIELNTFNGSTRVSSNYYPQSYERDNINNQSILGLYILLIVVIILFAIFLLIYSIQMKRESMSVAMDQQQIDVGESNPQLKATITDQNFQDGVHQA